MFGYHASPPGHVLLRGPLADQAALHRVLARVYALNLTLLALRRIEPEATEASYSQDPFSLPHRHTVDH